MPKATRYLRSWNISRIASATGLHQRDALTHPYLAGHGYAGVRVDIRGSGESGGLPLDEYAKQEQDDGLEVIAAGGAALVQRRGRDDGNLLGRVQRASDCGAPSARAQGDRHHLLDRRSLRRRCALHGRHASDRRARMGLVFFATVCLPPDPLLVGDRWRAMWLERLQNVPLFFELWLQHQRRDAYWKHGSVCEDYEAIQCPVYAVGGWTDAYKNAIPRLLERLTVPRKGLIGPWAHAYPHFARPGPQIGFLQEMLRWWDYWLKGIDTGVMDEPMLRAWMTDSVRPASHHETLPGRWVAEPSWPSPRITPRRLFLTDRGLRTQPRL